MSDKRSKYVSLPLKKKYEIACKLSQENVNVSRLAKDLNVPRTTLNTLRKQKNKIIFEFEAGRNAEMKRKRQHGFEDVDEPLVKWFRSARDEKIPVSGEMLVLKARQFASISGYDNVDKLDINWINRWKSREEVACKKLHGEAASVDEACVDDWHKNRLPILLKEFKKEHIFNADETGLFYKCLPDRTHVFKNETCAGGKLSKERLSVLVAASMAGEKLPLLVIGKAAQPRCFKNVKQLPLPYQSNSKAWMTSSIFETWVRKLDIKMKNNNRKIALVVDNCTAHAVMRGLTNVRLVFLPPNTTAKTQPMDAGVIRCLKAHYRKNLAEMRLLAFEGKKEFKVDVLEAMKLLDQAWKSVSDTTIQNCFRKVRFAPSTSEENLETTNESDNSAEGIWERLQVAGLVPEGFNFNEYVEGDSELITRETITEASIIDDLGASEHPADDQEDDDDEDNSLDEPGPTPFSALEAIKTLDRYYRTQGNSDVMLRNVSKMQQDILAREACNRTKQTKITHFFAS